MKRSVIFLSALIICWCAAGAKLHAQAPSHSTLVEAAKKEAKLVGYTSMAIDTSKPFVTGRVSKRVSVHQG